MIGRPLCINGVIWHNSLNKASSTELRSCSGLQVGCTGMEYGQMAKYICSGRLSNFAAIEQKKMFWLLLLNARPLRAPRPGIFLEALSKGQHDGLGLQP